MPYGSLQVFHDHRVFRAPKLTSCVGNLECVFAKDPVQLEDKPPGEFSGGRFCAFKDTRADCFFNKLSNPILGSCFLVPEDRDELLRDVLTIKFMQSSLDLGKLHEGKIQRIQCLHGQDRRLGPYPSPFFARPTTTLPTWHPLGPADDVVRPNEDRPSGRADPAIFRYTSRLRGASDSVVDLEAERSRLDGQRSRYRGQRDDHDWKADAPL